MTVTHPSYPSSQDPTAVDTNTDVGTILAAVDTEVAAIKTVVESAAHGNAALKTLIDTLDNFVDTEVAAIKAKTDLNEDVALKAAAVMVDNDVLFTVTGGPIKVLGLWSECVTANDATASTLVYKATPTAGSEQTLSAASASLANAAAGASISLIGTALTTAALLNANGPTLGMTAPMIVPAGTIAVDIATGSTTGTWRHYLRYEPLATGVTVA